MAPPRPPDYVAPPPPSLLDAGRTLRTIASDLLPIVVRLALERARPDASTSSEEGLAAVRLSFGRALRHLGVDLHVSRADALPRDGGLVLMWNQESHLDHLVLATAIPRPFFLLYNNAIARFPVYGEHLRATGHVHVDRKDPAQWRRAVADAARRVRAGEAALVSPEGTRSWDSRLLPMKRGAMLLAVESERPTICVTVIGGHARLPRGSAIVRGGPLRVVFSDPIGPERDPDVLASVVSRTFETLKRTHP